MKQKGEPVCCSNNRVPLQLAPGVVTGAGGAGGNQNHGAQPAQARELLNSQASAGSFVRGRVPFATTLAFALPPALMQATRAPTATGTTTRASVGAIVSRSCGWWQQEDNQTGRLFFLRFCGRRKSHHTHVRFINTIRSLRPREGFWRMSDQPSTPGIDARLELGPIFHTR